MEGFFWGKNLLIRHHRVREKKREREEKGVVEIERGRERECYFICWLISLISSNWPVLG